jgi:DNA-directed RNA polymerase sigma subunit (sigma70/sigma32)
VLDVLGRSVVTAQQHCTIEQAAAEFAAALAEDAATVAFVETELARKLRRLGANVEKAVAERNAAIIDARAAGHSLRSIGEAVGISHVAVRKILVKAGQAVDA